MKAFLGMGLLGSNFVRAMIKQGETVQVWNRTASRAQELEKEGAKAFIYAADAVKGATEIHITLKDDASVDEVLKAAEPGLAPGAIIIDHTTTSKEGAIARTRDWKEKGFTYQHAPVFMGPINALESTGYMLISGDEAIITALTPALSKLTGTLINFGEEVGKAAAMKLAGNAFLVCLTVSLKDTLTLSKSLDISLDELLKLFSMWNPGTLISGRLKRMAAPDQSKPSWELNMARKDTQLFLDATQQAGNELVLVPVIAALMDKFINDGFGSHDWTVIGK
ncbi:6-phosphogluconate dehydrogenase [Niastella koreensis]|uniref:6-phosphogluconate dehydrogenase NAD-binding protein n=2 Tax=Niastella koreensis TaxID=354356 RepID=G8TA10_NIAKG|nr:NAD(P)-dependent oxidoreductase [Niastella koreensis]AEW02382.1 6-phosphogluconate dehydrogenase NAD-binding protein [Niastella koreensis GR20-10]OQP54761.1 6-phosphogluconate dehydrogenase [Niastella koreensis]